MSIKISELPILDSLADNDIVAGVDVSGNVTSKIEMVTLKNYIDTNTQYTAGTNIDITNNVVSAPNVYNKTEMDEQIEELQSEVDSLSTIFNAFPTESDEDTSMTLDGTSETKFKKFDLKGNTSQDGTPTPSSPIPVNVVSGDNSIEICGKNILNMTGSTSYQGTSVNFTGSEMIFSKTTNGQGGISASPRTQLIPYLASQGDTFEFSGIYISGTINLTGDQDYRVYCYPVGIDGNTTNDRVQINLSKSSTTPSGSVSLTLTTDIIGFKLGVYFPPTVNTTTGDVKIGLQLEKSSTASTYEPYQGATYPINLPSGMELCKIGNYQDYFYKDSDKWYLHKEIGKVVLNGSESWFAEAQRYKLDNIIQGKTFSTLDENNPLAYCNGFKWGNGTSSNFVYGAFWYTANGLNLSMQKDENPNTTTLANFKTWLESNNQKVYYVLATPTITQITYQPLIDQLNLLEKAMSKDSQTNISQVSNDKPFILDVTAIKSLQNVLDRITLLES